MKAFGIGFFSAAAAISLAVSLGNSRSLQAAEPSGVPQLALDVGAHNNSIWQVSLDRGGEFFVTASSDRTLRVWDAASGELQQTLRPPVNPGSEGWFGSVAISPDGRTIAAGGGLCRTFESSYCVYLFDRASGALKQRILGFPSHVSRIVFSPDGQLLLALTVNDGVRLHRVQDGSLAGEDRDFGKQPAYTAAFSRDGLALVGSRDGQLRLYRTGTSGLERLVKRPAHSRGSPHAAAFSPDGKKVVVTHIFGGNNISVLDATTLDLLYNADTRTDKHGFISADWSADGRTLLVGTSAYEAGIRFVRAYADEGRGTFRNIEVSMHNIEDLKALPRGGFIAVTRDVAIAAYDEEYKPVFRINPSFLNYFYHPEALRVSRNGLAFSLPDGNAVFDPVSKRHLQPSPDTELIEPLTGGKNLRITAWRDSPNVNLDGKRLALVQPGNETSRALAIAADESSFVLGTSRGVYRFDRDGKRLWFITWPGEVVAVNHALDGKLIVAAQVNGNIRYLRASDGKLVFSAFTTPDRRRWLLYTPSGYYDASVGGEDLAGWLVNRGKLAVSDFYPLSRFRASHYKPAVIQAVQSTLDEKAALERAGLRFPATTIPAPSADRKQTVAPATPDTESTAATAIAQHLPPAVSVVSPGISVTADRSDFTLRVAIRLPADAPLTRLRVRVAGSNEEAKIRTEAATDAIHADISVKLPPEDTQIAVFAENRHGVSAPAVVQVKWIGAKPAVPIQRSLYVLAVGVSDYVNPEYRLGFAAKDAGDLVAALLRQKGGWYSRVEVQLITDRQATRRGVENGFAWLKERVRADDTAVIFLAGHGINDDGGDYHFMPADAELERVRATGVSFLAVRETLSRLPGKVLLMADTCHSGNILGRLRRGQSNDATAALNDLASAENGIVVFASSTGQQVSLESEEWGNGAFTRAVLEGLQGQADYKRRGRITYKMLDLYISDRVTEMTRGAQTPVSPSPVGVPDFVVAEVRK
jgi:dipeptidyl aminopeptidase/acylaminoacyl peptidase